MPVYDFKCIKCDKKFEEYKKLHEEAEIKCPDCGTFEVKQLISPVFVKMDIPPYFDHGLGCQVNGRQERNRIMKERGLEEMGTEKLDLGKQERERDRKAAKKMEDLKGEAMKMLNQGGHPKWN